MSNIIESFYLENNTPKALLKQKVAMFDHHRDIAVEFEKWIVSNEYVTDHAVCVEGYTAKRLAETFENLNGEGAFVMLVELRENPKKALGQISKGLKRK